MCYNLQQGGKNSEKTREHRLKISESVSKSLGKEKKASIRKGKNGWQKKQGMSNPQADKTLRKFRYGDKVVICTQSELRLAYSLDHSTLGRLVRLPDYSLTGFDGASI